MSNETTGLGPINPYGDLSRRARRELEAKGINPDEALATYNQTGNIEALTGSITIIPPKAEEPEVVEPEVAEPEVEAEPEVVAEASALTPTPAAPEISPVPASSIFPVGLSRRDEVSMEQRLTAEIPTIEVEAEEESAVEDDVVEDDVVEEVVAEDVEDEEIVPIDLEPVEVESVRIDQREDREEITNEFEPFTITTTSTGIIPTTSHALVLPTLPEEDPSLIAAMNQTGEIVITGQITLPASIASVGADTASLDTADIDLVVEDLDTGSGQDLAPVSAAQAVSSFSGTAINVTMPKRSSEKLPVILAISAAVLALGVVGLFVANYFLRVF